MTSCCTRVLYAARLAAVAASSTQPRLRMTATVHKICFCRYPSNLLLPTYNHTHIQRMHRKKRQVSAVRLTIPPRPHPPNALWMLHSQRDEERLERLNVAGVEQSPLAHNGFLHGSGRFVLEKARRAIFCVRRWPRGGSR